MPPHALHSCTKSAIQDQGNPADLELSPSPESEMHERSRMQYSLEERKDGRVPLSVHY